MQLADCGRDVWVGNFEACDARHPEFARAIHVWYGAAGKGACRYATDGAGDDMLIVYHDGRPLAESGIDLPRVVDYCRQPGRLLVHCAAGMCRGPTFALLALVARGGGTRESLVAIAEGMARYGIPCCPLIAPKVYVEIQNLEATLRHG